MRRTTLLAMMALAACAPTPPPPSPAPAPLSSTPARDPVETEAPEQTMNELKKQPITALDLALYRLRTELSPDLEKHLRAQGLLRRTPAINNEDVTKAGFVMVKLAHAKVDPYGTLVEISVNTPDSGAAASAQTISELQQLNSKVVAVVRDYVGGPCAASDDPNLNKYSSCSSAFYFYDWFAPPSVSAFNEPMAGRERAGYNIYSLVQVNVWGRLAGKHTVVLVNCTGPVIRVEVKCATSGE
jgi:hypothetical protein